MPGSLVGRYFEGKLKDYKAGNTVIQVVYLHPLTSNSEASANSSSAGAGL